jgi:DNA-binding CsgD family transcriptional regulator/GAF domain-containing protein
MHQAIDIDRFSELLTSLYDGPFESVPWTRFLQALRTWVDVDMTFLILRPPGPGDNGMIFNAGIESIKPRAGNMYADGMYALDPFVNLPAGRVVTLDEYIGNDTLRASEFYLSCLKPSGIFHIAGIDLLLQDGFKASLRLTRGAEDRAFKNSDREFLQRLVPHLERAIAIHARFARIETERSLYDRTMAQLSLGTIILDEHRHVMRMNRIAENLLAQKDGVRLLENQIHLDRSQDNARLRSIITDAIDAQRHGQTQLVQAMAIARGQKTPGHGRAPLNMVIRPVTQTEFSDGQGCPSVALFLSDPELPMQASTDILAQLFDLTPAESRLALQLTNGASLEEASSELGISRNTARAHLRSIFAKTGVTQQTMLVSLILKSVAVLTTP